MFCVPGKLNPKFLKGIEPYSKRIGEVYLSEPKTLVGHGRPSTKIRMKVELRDFVEELKSLKVEPNYLLNSSCCGGLEFERDWISRFVKFVERLVNVGVENFTVTIPYLLEVLKSEFDVKVVVSVIAGIDSVRKALFWQEIGADAIYLDISINRDFRRLKAIKGALKIEVGVVLNEACLLQCPVRSYHFNLVSHSSREGKSYDYPLRWCRRIILENPSEIIRSPWIRPEDVRHYSFLDRFKIVGRDMRTEFVVRCIKAYTEGRWRGNLVDVLPINVPFFVDNSKLDGFLNWFLEGRCDGNCLKCGYCDRVAERVIT